VRNNEIVKHALRHAKLTDKQAYVLGRYMDGMKQREIAAEVGIKQPTVAKLIAVAIKKLRNVFPLYNQINIAKSNPQNIQNK
jgi:DNA-directed RNA polymerase specialized sigma subunit